MKGLIKMSLLLDAQAEINADLLGTQLDLKTKILALKAIIAQLRQEKAQLTEQIAQQAQQITQLEAEIETLNNTLANIGSVQDLWNIIAPTKTQGEENKALAQDE